MQRFFSSTTTDSLDESSPLNETSQDELIDMTELEAPILLPENWQEVINHITEIEDKKAVRLVSSLFKDCVKWTIDKQKKAAYETIEDQQSKVATYTSIENCHPYAITVSQSLLWSGVISPPISGLIAGLTYAYLPTDVPHYQFAKFASGGIPGAVVGTSTGIITGCVIGYVNDRSKSKLASVGVTTGLLVGTGAGLLTGYAIFSINASLQEKLNPYNDDPGSNDAILAGIASVFSDIATAATVSLTSAGTGMGLTLLSIFARQKTMNARQEAQNYIAETKRKFGI